MKKNKYIVSVIIPVYNCDNYLSIILENLIKQSLKDLEIIIIDDGSTDNTSIICNKYEKEYDFISCIHKQNSGVSSARNDGIKKATGKYIYFCDADDNVSSNLLSVLVNEMEKKDADLVSCNYENFFHEKDLRFKITNNVIYFTNNKYVESIIGDKNNKIGGYLWNKLFKREIINKYNIYFDEKINLIEDSIFVLEYCKHSELIIHNESVLYGYRYNFQSATRQKFSIKNIEATYGQEKVYKILNNFCINPSTKKHMWKTIMNSIMFSYIKLWMKKKEKYLIHKKRLKMMFDNYKNEYSIFELLNYKNILRYIFINYL